MFLIPTLIYGGSKYTRDLDVLGVMCKACRSLGRAKLHVNRLSMVKLNPW